MKIDWYKYYFIGSDGNIEILINSEMAIPSISLIIATSCK